MAEGIDWPQERDGAWGLFETKLDELAGPPIFQRPATLDWHIIGRTASV